MKTIINQLLNWFATISYLVLCLLTSCQNTEKQEFNLSKIAIHTIDSMSLSNELNSFMVYGLNDAPNGKILGFNYPILDLSVIENNGRITKISEAGSGPGEFNGFINAIITDENEVIALTETNDSKIVLFDSTLAYKNEIKLINVLNDYLPGPTKSCLHVFKNGNGQFEVYFSLESLKYSEFENKGFYDGYGVVKLIIDQSFEEPVQNFVCGVNPPMLSRH